MEDVIERKVAESKETGFNQEMTLEFYRSGNKLLTKYKSGPSTGKYIFPNRTENLDEIEEGMPYRCMVKETENAGFAKIICRVFIPRIIIRDSYVVATVKQKSEVKHMAFASLQVALQHLIAEGIYQWFTMIQVEDFSSLSGKIDIDLFKIWSGKE